MKRVLLVEDDAVPAGAVTALLGMVYLDVDVDRVESAAAGLAKLALQRYDMLVLDLMLPESTPPETVAAFSPYMKTMPTIVVSGYCDSSTVQLCLEHGADCCIPKAELSLTTLRLSTRLATLEHKVAKMAQFAGVSKPGV